MGKFLWKPKSESDGGLVILGDFPTSGLRLVDLSTGQVLSEGRQDVRAGRDNGYQNGFRFSGAGSNFNNVAVVDDQGRVVGQVGNGGARVEGSFDSLDNLYKNPINTSASRVQSNQGQSETNSVPSKNASMAKALGVAVAPPAAYAGYKALKPTDAILGVGAEPIMSEQPSVLGLAGQNAAGMAGTLGGAGALAGVLGGAALTAKGAKDLLSGKETKGLEGWGGRGQLALTTGGLSEVARGLGFGRKTTKDYGAERRANVINAGNTGWKDYFSNNPQGNDKVTPENITRDASGNWVKPDGTWDAREYAGVQGNADTFGDDWFKLNEAQRNALVTKFKDENLYHSNKGDVLISDGNQARARELFNETLNQPAQGSVLDTPTVNKPATVPTASNVPIPEAPLVNRSAQMPAGENTGVSAKEISGDELLALEANQGQDKMMKQNLALSMLGSGNNMSGQLLNEAVNPQKKNNNIDLGVSLGNIFFR